jgi:hypothetical protein
LFYIFFILIIIVDGTNLYTYIGVRLGPDRMIVGFITVCNQRLYITAKVVSLNPSHGEVYSVQHYVIKFLSDFRQVSGFLWVLQFLSLIKESDRHELTGLLLKVALNTITLTDLHITIVDSSIQKQYTYIYIYNTVMHRTCTNIYERGKTFFLQFSLNIKQNG